MHAIPLVCMVSVKMLFSVKFPFLEISNVITMYM